MTFRLLQPPPSIRKIVRYIHVIESGSAAGQTIRIPFFADGCPGIIFQQCPDGLYLSGEAKKLDPFFLYGQTIKPNTLVTTGSCRIILCCLYPHVLNSLWDIDSRELTDDCYDLSLAPGFTASSFFDQLYTATSIEEQVKLVCRYIEERARLRNENPDPLVQFAVSQILVTNGNASLPQLRRQLQVSERTFERRFGMHVGLGPKLFTRICRFQSSLAQLKKQDFSKLSDLAYDNGYADQSHFIRAFREFTGFSPLEFQKRVQLS